jgi:hypothetical protein
MCSLVRGDLSGAFFALPGKKNRQRTIFYVMETRWKQPRNLLVAR